jgi:hypothetical protein
MFLIFESPVILNNPKLELLVKPDRISPSEHIIL